MNDENIKTGGVDYPEHPSDPSIIPDATYWPVSLAFGITLFLWGFITFAIVSLAGLIYIFVSLSGWITDLNNEE